VGWFEPAQPPTAPWLGLSAEDPGNVPEVLLDPTALELIADPNGEAWIMGREFLGREWLIQVHLEQPSSPPLKLRLRLPLDQDFSHGQRCRVRIRPGQSAVLFPERLRVVVSSTDGVPGCC
jgi:iron(III) transport system ATP-binding protein